MTQASLPFPQLFKGIALFTPGGDLVYCIDPLKHNRWHLQLCAVLQEILGLSEPPHFLVPCYTATIDRWLDPRTQQLKTSAEACPLVLRYQPLLNAVFETEGLVWKPTPQPAEICTPAVLSTYKSLFPELWQDHDLIVRLDKVKATPSAAHPASSTLSWSPSKRIQGTQGYVLRLFVSGSNAGTERILQNLHRLLETSLQQPYTLKVVDIYKHPDQAELDQVAATPTLVKVWPRPIRRIVGDLDNVDKILSMLASPETYGNF